MSVTVEANFIASETDKNSKILGADARFESIIYGYIREQHELRKLNIPHEIFSVILLFYKTFIDSKILSEDEKSQLYAMVVEQLKAKHLYFQPIYRGTRNGFGYHDFWNVCNKIKPAFVIIETTADKVCGGYTSVGFDKSSTYQKDEDAFLYSIRNDKEHPPKIFPVLKKQSHCAISYYDKHLCGFGSYSSGILLAEDCNLPGKYCLLYGMSYMQIEQYNYLNAGQGDKIQLKELELFQVII